MKSIIYVVIMIVACGVACSPGRPKSSDTTQMEQQETLLAEGTAQVGMPAIKNFRERKMLRDILELRDQTGFATYTYLVGDDDAKLVFLCDSIGYGLPYATQFTNPEKLLVYRGDYGGNVVIPQADPNGLFSPAAAEGTWVMCKDPSSSDVGVLYVEPRIIVSTFKLGAAAKTAESPAAK